MDDSNDSMLIYDSIIECCLGLMHSCSSVLLLIIIMDGLQEWTTIYMLLVSCPLYSFVVICLDKQRNTESLFWWSTCWCPKILISSHLLRGDIPIRWLPCFPLELVAHVCFLVFLVHLFCFPFLEKTSHILLLLQRVFEVWNFQKRELLQISTVRLFFFKNSINGWFCFC